MKIKTKQLSYEEVQKLPDRVHKKPAKPNRLVKKLVLVLSAGELKKVGFTYESVGMERLKKDEPCLILIVCSKQRHKIVYG